MPTVRHGLAPCLVLVASFGASFGASSVSAATAQTSADGAENGNASYYSHHLSGRRTASGQAYDPKALTAAHRTLPIGTQVRVVNPKNDKSVVVTVNDRGPMRKSRMIDVSSAAADRLGMKKSGVTKVETQVVGKNASKDDRVAATSNSAEAH